MQITRQADYAVRAVLYLAQLDPGARASTAQIASERHIPLTFLAKIISQLSAAGIIRARRGAHGGVTLGRAAEEITLLDVVEAIDGPITLSECTLNPATCQMSDHCVVRVLWCATREDLVRRLSQSTFGQLAQAAQTVSPAVSPAALVPALQPISQ